MADNTKIEWTDASWNPITGCTVHSAGCTNCYAMKLAGTRLRNHPSRAGLTTQTKAGPVWNGQVRFNEDWLTQPLKWKRPRMIFVCAHADLFHESVQDEWIDRIFAVMALCPQHTFQVLTKRSARMREYCNDQGVIDRIDCFMDELISERVDPLNRRSDDLRATAPCMSDFSEDWPLPNVWLGVSVENQAAADERIPDLLSTPAAVRWISAEPLLGPVDLRKWIGWVHHHPDNQRSAALDAISAAAFAELKSRRPDLPRIDWVIAGGESGTGARPMHPYWARSLRDQCAAAGTPFFFKQWGEWAPGENASRPATRTEQAASWDHGRWFYESITAKMSEEMHRDYEPDVFRFGKTAAGRLLDGALHDGMPR